MQSTQTASKDVSYDNSKSGISSTNMQGAIDELYTKAKNHCPDDYECIKRRTSLEVVDYIKMTPTSTSYTIPASETGYTSNQTINPSELNVWRVLSISSSGIEVISENASSTQVYFKGKTGYQNYVGALNKIAAQYTNSKYVVSTRYFGYNGQTEYITHTSKITQSTAPWTTDTVNNSNESLGGGDVMYIRDTDLVTKVFGTLVLYSFSGVPIEYLLASRSYGYTASSTYFPADWRYLCRRVDSKISDRTLYSYDSWDFGNGIGLHDYTQYGSLRPILIFKSTIPLTAGLGTHDFPYVLD